MSTRPLVRVYNGKGEVVDQVRLPSVFTAPIRSDIVQFVHTNLNKNWRQPYGVAKWAGHQSSAESWGTGRAVSRIPRVPGGGTHRAGQGAFGNMCRGGRMFGPIRVIRRWHRPVHVGQKRYAVVSALAASAVAPLVMARGHRISQIAEVPLVVANDAVERLGKTKKAVALLKQLKANEDTQRVKATLQTRAGKGKMRNRPYKERIGPLIVYADNNAGICQAFRGIQGVELMNVHSLSLIRLAPGGHLGRFIIWTRSAFEQLDSIFGTFKKDSKTKKGFRLPHPIMKQTDLFRITRSDVVRGAMRQKTLPLRFPRRINPFASKRRMDQLNPYARIAARITKERAAAAKLRKEKARVAWKKHGKPHGFFGRRANKLRSIINQLP